MKNLWFIIPGIFFCTGFALAQNDKEKKEIVFDKKLVCPFEWGIGREAKEAYSWDSQDMKVSMISKEDTVVRSCIDAKVSNIQPSEEGRYEIVIYYKDYYFWYSGVSKALVKINQSVKSGEVLATYTKGQELEFRMFKDEEMMDPRKFLECKINPEKQE